MNWQWTHIGNSIDNPGEKQQHAGRRWAIQICIMLLVALAFLYFRKKVPAIVVFVMALIQTILGIFAPSALSRLEERSRKTGIWIAEKIIWVVLAIVYFIFFVPIRLILLLMHKDPLERQFPGKQPSYWKTYRSSSGTSKYLKQY